MPSGSIDVLTAADPSVVRAMLAPGVTFHSPVADYRGLDDVAHLLALIGRCLDRIEARAEYTAGSRSVSEFTAEVRGRAAGGVLVRQMTADGMLDEVTLLLRPLSALQEAVECLRDALAEHPLPSRQQSR